MATTIDAVLRDLVREVVRDELQQSRAQPNQSAASVSRSDGFLSVAEAAELAGVHASTIRGWINTNQLRSYRAGRHHRLKRSDIESFMGGTPSTGPVDVDALARRLAAG